MLVFTREIGETFHIGEDIKIHILAVRGSQVKVGIEAPKSIKVDREEIYLRKRAELGNTKTLTK